MISTSTTCIRLCWIAAAIVLAGCTSTPTRFYTLSVQPQDNAPTATQAQNAQIFIDVSPVTLPERLARPQLVVRTTSGTRVDILEHERWSSPFNNELRDALASGIASRLGAIDVSRSGRPADQPVYRITIALREFDAAPGEKIQATYGWTIMRSDNRRTTACQLTTSEPVGPGIDALVQGIQRTVASAVIGIAANITTLKANAPPVCQS